MRTEEKSNVKNSISRLIIVGISVIIQVTWIVFLFVKLNKHSTLISLLSSIIALCIVLRIYGQQSNAAFKIPWIILILVFPVFGLCIYLIFGRSNLTARMKRRFENVDHKLQGQIIQKEEVMEQLSTEHCDVANQCRYINDYGKYPVWQNTDVVYYKNASEGFEAQLEELRKAEKFIFMEYHAIEEKVSFARMKKVLADRAKHGVEVRVIYDDIGSVGYINTDFIKRMEESGIKCRVFNRVVPFLNVFMNNRDHRKVTVIDGKVGFTGGYNLADEYFNLTHPFGNWKDTGIRLEGDAVKSLTNIFLEMWNVIKESDTDFSKYFINYSYCAKEKGYIQPYADSPIDGERVGESVYMNLIKCAKHSLYIMTPYLLITDEMNLELSLAAKRGVDVRIVTPGIPDKKIIYKMTRSYYGRLVKNGVQIYEYTPGFVHAKQFLCDGEIATIGTINMDYRSLYLHFENGAFLYGYDCIKDIEDDFKETFVVSRNVTEQYHTDKSVMLRGAQCVMRLFAPLL